MKRSAFILLVALVAAGLGYFLVGLRYADRDEAFARARGADLVWLRTEFQLNDAQFAAVSSLHDRYGTTCARHCEEIVAARARLAELRDAQAAAADIAAAERRLAELEAVCNNATRAHLREVAAAMPAGQGQRFLAMVEPHLAQLPHDGVRSMSR